MARIRVDFFFLGVDGTFDALRGYATRMEEQVVSLATAELTRLRQQRFEDEADWHIERQGHEFLFEWMIPRILRYGCLVSFFSAVESSLTGACKELEARNALPPFATLSTREKGITRALKYLTQTAKIALSPSPLLTRLKAFGEVRHCIVHANGNVEGMNPKKRNLLKRLISTTDGLSFDRRDEEYVDIAPGVVSQLVVETHEWVAAVLTAAGFGPRYAVVEGEEKGDKRDPS